VSLEQDLELAARILPGPGATLFAGGADALSVRVLDADLRTDPALARLGELFHPRPGRDSRYRQSRLAAHRASLAEVERLLVQALDAARSPLIVYVAAHGEQGSEPRENHVGLWGGDPLTVARVAELHDAHPRPLRLVVSACFSGGFAELAFKGADERSRFAEAPRCGLFSGPWDRQTTGCDPNPDRRAQEGYGLHMLHALARKDREGRALGDKAIDFDGDGRISLLEAHTRARIASTSFDVPTTTSERWLRSVQPGRGATAKGLAPADASALPEEAAVIEQLGGRLDSRSRATVERRARAVAEKLDQMDEELDRAEEVLDRTTAALMTRLLERWPVLDDPYHADFTETLEQNRDAVRRMLERSNEAKAYRAASALVDRLDSAYHDLQIEEAAILRLERAYETVEKAAALRRRGGAAYKAYLALLECERTVP
jgi:hypothetical protein